MYCDLWPYVWLVFKSGFSSRAGYSGARTVIELIQMAALIWTAGLQSRRSV